MIIERQNEEEGTEPNTAEERYQQEIRVQFETFNAAIEHEIKKLEKERDAIEQSNGAGMYQREKQPTYRKRAAIF